MSCVRPHTALGALLPASRTVALPAKVFLRPTLHRCVQTTAARLMKPATPSTSTGSYESKVPGTRLNPWDQHKLEQKYPTLTNDTSCDVCIIGAGLAGLSTAYRLVKAGKSVVVLESRVRGAGDTGRSVGLLSTWNNEYIREVERVCGANNARVSAEAHSAAISFINQVVKEENIKCGFEMVPGYLLSSSDQGHGMTSKHPSLSEEMEAAKRAGLDVKMEKLGSDSGFQPYGKVHSEALAFPLCANVHPLAYVEGLAAAIVKHGGQIFENTRAKGGVVTGPSKGRVKTMSGHTVTAREGVVMATRSPINRDQLWVHNRQLPQRLYTVALEVPEGAVKNAQYYDTSGKHLTYARLASNPSGKGKLLLVHGEGHKYGLGENKYEERDPWAALESWARQHFPACGAVQYCWSTMDYFPADLLGLYGQDPFDYSHPPNYILTGHNGQEWTGSTLGSEIIANTILKKPNPWAGTYNPSRVWAGATGKYAGELATYFSTVGVALVKHLVPRSLSDVAGMISPASVESKIMPGQGAVVQHGLRKKAMYRDNDGVLHMKSALCTHLGCCVAWNELDRTFDCPCHGSQYDACGRCIHAPAVADLEDLGTKM